MYLVLKTIVVTQVKNEIVSVIECVSRKAVVSEIVHGTVIGTVGMILIMTADARENNEEIQEEIPERLFLILHPTEIVMMIIKVVIANEDNHQIIL